MLLKARCNVKFRYAAKSSRPALGMSYVGKSTTHFSPFPSEHPEILENYYFSPRRHPENVENVEQKNKTTLHQWMDLIERSPKMPLAVALLNGKMVSDAPKDARSFFFLMLLKVVPILGRTLCC